MIPALLQTSIRSLPLLSRGKVRENYAIDEHRMLMVATDRISAFDVIMAEPIPGKGEILTRMARFWFGLLDELVPHHLLPDDPESVVAPDEREQVRGRAMVVKRLKPLPIEAVVRGYIAGSGWKDYQATGSVCGVKLPAGLKLASRLPEPIFTPATKAELGAHDENISFSQMAATIGAETAIQVHDASLAIYQRAADYAAARGILIADTKFEFGLDEHGTVTLMDEVLTPDSSRFWPADTWKEGVSPPSFDKQFLRDWLESVPSWNKQPPPPHLPPDIIAKTAERYREALQRLTG